MKFFFMVIVAFLVQLIVIPMFPWPLSSLSILMLALGFVALQRPAWGVALAFPAALIMQPYSLHDPWLLIAALLIPVGIIVLSVIAMQEYAFLGVLPPLVSLSMVQGVALLVHVGIMTIDLPWMIVFSTVFWSAVCSTVGIVAISYGTYRA